MFHGKLSFASYSILSPFLFGLNFKVLNYLSLLLVLLIFLGKCYLVSLVFLGKGLAIDYTKAFM